MQVNLPELFYQLRIKAFIIPGTPDYSMTWRLIGEMTKIDYMLLSIGDNFTMGITDAVKAAELVNPKLAIPMPL